MDDTTIIKIANNEPLEDAEKDQLTDLLRLLGSYGEIKGLVDGLFRRGTLEMAPRIYSFGLIAGSGIDPDLENTDFTGTFLLFPPITLPNGDTADIGGMNAGTIKWYGRSSDGTLVAGGGNVTLDENGIRLIAPEFPDGIFVEWLADDTGAQLGSILGWYVDGVASGLYTLGKGKDVDHYGVVGMASMTHDQVAGEFKTLFELTTNGLALLNLKNVNGAAGVQSMAIQTRISDTNTLNAILSLLTQSTGTPAAGLGSVMEFEAENSAGEDQQIGYIGAEYTDVTNGSEDSRLAIGRYKAGALENGYLDWGTYTPALTNVTNIAASTPRPCQWMRVGSVVTVSGNLDADPTTTGATRVDIELPIASNLASATGEDCSGTAACSAVAGLSAIITGASGVDRAAMVWTAVDTANRSFSFQFTYLII